MYQDGAHSEAERIRREYAMRRSDRRIAARYRFTAPGHLLLIQDRERALLAMLVQQGWTDRLGGARILDVGCGSGGTLVDFLRYGARADHLHGVDLLEPDVMAARERLPQADLRCSDATELPYPSASFDIVTQILVLSTILDLDLRRQVAREMRRVLHPDGLILSYDVRWPSPGNQALRKVRRADLRALFPGMAIASQSLTLAPPLARLVAPRQWWLATLLQALPPLHSHLLAAMRVRHPL